MLENQQFVGENKRSAGVLNAPQTPLTTDALEASHMADSNLTAQQTQAERKRVIRNALSLQERSDLVRQRKAKEGERYRFHQRLRAKKYNAKYPKKAQARKAVTYAKQMGRLVVQPCEVCGTTKTVEGHHDDYAQLLVVRWLCQPHHREHHRLHGEGKNAR